MTGRKIEYPDATALVTELARLSYPKMRDAIVNAAVEQIYYFIERIFPEYPNHPVADQPGVHRLFTALDAIFKGEKVTRAGMYLLIQQAAEETQEAKLKEHLDKAFSQGQKAAWVL